MILSQSAYGSKSDINMLEKVTVGQQGDYALVGFSR